MRVDVFGMPLLLTNQVYLRETREAFNEAEAIDTARLNVKLTVYEDELAELLDQYCPYTDKGPYWCADINEHLLDLWRLTMRIKHVQLRIQLSQLSIPFLGVPPANAFDPSLQPLTAMLSAMSVD